MSRENVGFRLAKLSQNDEISNRAVSSDMESFTTLVSRKIPARLQLLHLTIKFHAQVATQTFEMRPFGT